MLERLRRIVQEVNAAADLAQALDLIVAHVRQALAVDVCSVYLTVPGQEALQLMATEGLNPESEGKVRLGFDEGLVGLVAQRAEPVNLENAPDHPRYKYFPETGEERYHAFLGVPIVHQRKLLGVLVIQQRSQRRFDEEYAAFLITLGAQLAGAISHAEMSGEIAALRKTAVHEDLFISGVCGAPGVAIGIAWVAYPKADLEAVPEREAEDPEQETLRFREAVSQVRAEMQGFKARMGSALPLEEQALFDAYTLMLKSDSLFDRTLDLIAGGQWAQGALKAAVRESTHVFEEMEDGYLRERAADVRDLGRRILLRLQGSGSSDEREYPESTVLIGDDISVTDLGEIPVDRLAGVVSGQGSSFSHVAILARALGVPAIMGVAELPMDRLEGCEVVLDGYLGRVFIAPSEQVKQEYGRLAREERQLSQELREIADEPAVTPDGSRIPVYINSGLLAEASTVLQAGSDGIGLYRTEFPFMIRERFPGEDEQYDVYRQVLAAVHPRPATLRTLDVGGDKPLPYFPVLEDNPFLGWRGIRITLDHPEIFLTQLRAMLRASEGLNNLQVLLPMVGSVGQVDEALDLLQRAWLELLDEGVNSVMPGVGVMIEVPSAVYLTAELARKVDFLSVGTNDLAQYLLAVDRNNARVASLYQSLHPAVLRAILQVVEGAHMVGKPVSICGEMASDPASVLLLLGMGVDSLSVSVAALPKVKWVIRSFSRQQMKTLFQDALLMQDPILIREALNEVLTAQGLGALVRPGHH
jgi:phosphotransferase system, enzyme I, PtsP